MTLPEGFDTDAMLPAAADRGVIYLPSSWFYPDRSWTRSMRLDFSSQPEDRIIEAMERLAETIRAYVQPSRTDGSLARGLGPGR